MSSIQELLSSCFKFKWYCVPVSLAWMSKEHLKCEDLETSWTWRVGFKIDELGF